MRIEITDPDDPRIAVFQGLRDHVLRQRRERDDGDMAGLFMAEGDIVLERAIAAGYVMRSVLIDTKRTKPMPAVIADDVPVYACSPPVLRRITGYDEHRGALACFNRRPVPEAAELLDGDAFHTVLVLEGINNPTNLGVILRCAAALGVEAFFLDPSCSDPLYRRSGRVSMGEAYALPYARLDAFPDGLAALADRGYRVLALTPGEGAIDLPAVSIGADDRVAILLGTEGAGLTDAAMEAADECVRIPMSGTVDSINVGAAAAVTFYGLQQARAGG